MAYWLFKTEPAAFSIDDLMARPNQTEPWDGVRNYQARNFLRDEVAMDDEVLIYHSSCNEVGVAGIATIARAGYPDYSQFDPESAYFDPKSEPDNPRWYRVDVLFKEKFSQILTLKFIKKMPEIEQLPLVKKGHRLSVMPVCEKEWNALVSAARSPRD
ncbi:EVE domain-containing protein [Salinimonas chungwhensis]|uniref:EVE domain-containing protein n=1 Tax=Salinimonas chungwhensis TaxID=265425 RepID=UPI000371AE58|nr:EVE domain-containing protein [Salinimonas chungwhensis]